MSKRGTTYQMVTTRRHCGYGGPCDVIRRRPGERRYHSLTRASAHRWLDLAQGGQARVIRDSGPEFLHDLAAGKAWKSAHERGR